MKKRLGVTDRVYALRSLAEESPELLPLRLRRYFNDRSPRLREEAVTLCRKHELWHYESELFPLLADKSHFVRSAVVEFIGDAHSGQQITMPQLYPLLADAKELVRVETLEALGRIGDKASLPLIVRALEDEDSLVRGYAALTLGEFGLKRFRRVVERAATKEPDATKRAMFASALYQLGDSTRYHELLDCLKSEHYIVRCFAANALTYLDLDPEQQAAALSAVADASIHFLYRGDQSTMETVMVTLREALEA